MLLQVFCSGREEKEEKETRLNGEWTSHLERMHLLYICTYDHLALALSTTTSHNPKTATFCG